MIIAKFGGSSVKDDQALLDCVKVVEQTPQLGVVVISATYNTTNDLEELFLTLKEKDELSSKGLWNKIQSKHKQMAIKLGNQIEKDLDILLDELDKELLEFFEVESLGYEHRDHILSFGERISSSLFYWTIKKRFPEKAVKLVDATELIKTDSSFGLARVEKERTAKACREFQSSLASGDLLVTQGFLGIDREGKRTTLGREGSDYTATLLADALEAKEVHIWTDVDGIYSADPNIVSKAKRLEALSYAEATLMAKAGAKVLFPKTLQPLVEKGIPLKVGKTSQPLSGGTWIGKDKDSPLPLIGITLKERSDGLIITLVGKGVDKIEIEISEIDRGEEYRSFFHPEKNNHEVLNLWYERYFL